MQLYQSTLPSQPPPLDPRECFLQLAFTFGRDSSTTHLELQSPHPILTPALLRAMERYKTEGLAFMRGHFGHFSISVPAVCKESERVRLHFAVPYIDGQLLNSPTGIKHSGDFDRLMDLVQSVAGQMLEAKIIAYGKSGLDIVAEPLTANGKLRINKIDRVAFGGSTWLQNGGHYYFAGYRYWDPKIGNWRSDT